DMHNVEGKEKHGKERIKTADDQTTQVASVLTAGGDFVSQAGRDTTVVASKISAGNEAYLYSGDKLSLLAAQDSTHTLYDMKENGGWGAKKAKRDEVTQTTNVGTDIRTTGNLTLVSNGDQLYQVAKLNSGKDLILKSGGAITFEGVKDYHDESHTKSKSNMAWFSMKGKGETDETLRQSELVAQGQTVIQAVNGLKIDVKQVNQQTVSQTIDAMVTADPQLAWIKEAEKRGDVDWRQVKELHDSFKYSNSGMGQGAMLAVIIIVTIVTAGGASALAGGAASATAGSGTAMAAATTTEALAAGATYTAAGWGNVMATAALTSMASTGAVSVINNKGNLGVALKDTFGSDSLKNATIGALTAGALNYADSTWFQGASPANGNGAKVITGGSVQNPGYSSQWLSWQKAQDAVVRSGTHAVIESGISTAINGGSLRDNLGSALVSQGFDLAAAVGNKNLGDFADYMDLSPGSAEKVFLHAMLGGAMSAARGGDFKTGAIAAGAAEGLTGVATDNLGKYLDTRFVTDDQFRVATAQIVGIAAGSLVNGDPNDAAWVAGNVERYNAQLHRPQTTALEKLRTLNPELSDRLTDAACALSQCAASIPVDDPRYGNFKARQDRGEGYTTEIEMLQATGEFEGRSWTDRSDDFLNAHGNVVQAADASVDTASGIVGGVGSYAGMMVTSPVCVGIFTCALPAGLGVLGTHQLVGAWDSASQITSDFTSDQPGRVEAAFNLGTFPGESSITKDLAASAGQSVLEMSAFGLAGKYFNGLSAADGVAFPWSGESVVGPKATPSGLVSGETGVVGTGKAAANDASFTATSTSGWTSISSDARAVVRDVEYHSGVPMPSNQRTQLAEELRQVDHTYVAPRSDYQALQREYNSQRNNLKREWELNTGLTWPKTESGVDFQAHHVIPQQYGGPNQWWNLHPVPGGSAHQGGVHAPASPTTTAFPQNPPRRP
ncbi:DUF637 domain-containing protein, partial [Pseudomonas sp. ME-P-057]|uniref:DUF637 domain-containing protein n=1 Tax=Pseudomonas sp. ME-P-057 TaxID=3040321 RepID=UPI00255259B1